MPALTISAVDNTTDRLTVTGHGQVNGAGPAAVYIGAGGVIPGGLAPVTDYWLIVIDANTVKLATSSTNALAGTAIDITSNGTLPLQLLIGLPYRRPMTAAAGAQIKSANDNSTWDTLVAMWNYLTGQAQSIFNDLVLASGKNIQLAGAGYLKHGNYTKSLALTIAGWNVTAGGVPSYATPAGSPGATVENPANNVAYYQLPIENNNKAVINVKLRLAYQVGAGNGTVSLFKGAPGSGNFSALTGASATVLNGGAAADVTITPTTPYQQVSGESLWLKVAAGTGGALGIPGVDIVYNSP